MPPPAPPPNPEGPRTKGGLWRVLPTRFAAISAHVNNPAGPPQPGPDGLYGDWVTITLSVSGGEHSPVTSGGYIDVGTAIDNHGLIAAGRGIYASQLTAQPIEVGSFTATFVAWVDDIVFPPPAINTTLASGYDDATGLSAPLSAAMSSDEANGDPGSISLMRAARKFRVWEDSVSFAELLRIPKSRVYLSLRALRSDGTLAAPTVVSTAIAVE
jgi:hypothetical protein